MTTGSDTLARARAATGPGERRAIFVDRCRTVATRNVLIALLFSALTGCVGSAPQAVIDGAETSDPLGGAVVDRYPFSTDYQRPSSKQGTGEARQGMSASDADARYQRLKSLGVAYREYNLWWSGLESSGMTSSATPMACPAGYELFPANETERAQLGYHRYRCVSLGELARFDELFRRDQAAGMQTAVVMWSSPEVYRYPGCHGFAWAGGVLKEGCVPRDDAMDDFEDYANLLASRYNGGANGKISHFIVWNENASGAWCDYSPVVSMTDLSSASVERRIDKYADMMRRVHAALMRHQKAALMYASTDMLWTPGQTSDHYGTKWLLDGLWVRLGVNYSWSVAVHPYGDVDRPAASGTYTFSNLEMVVDHQYQRLQERGVSGPEMSMYPQSLLLASEQGWPIATAVGTAGARGRESQARQLCLAHDKAVSMSQLVAVGHNYFQSVEPAENEPNGSSGQGSFFGLLPYAIPDSLAGMEATPTGKAFISTMNPGNWKQRDDHYCCEVYGLGCVGPTPATVPSVDETHQVIGVIDGVVDIGGYNTISGWACARTIEQPISVHLYAGGDASSGQLLGAFTANVASEPAVVESCKAHGSAYRFQIALDATTEANFGGQKIYLHGISPVGLSNNLLGQSGTFLFPSRR